MAQEIARQVRTEMLEKLVAQQTGLDGNSALARHYATMAQGLRTQCSGSTLQS